MREKYETDLKDEQWEVIAPLFVNMRKRKWDKRELVNAVLYLVKTGCQWEIYPMIFRRFLPSTAFIDVHALTDFGTKSSNTSLS